MQYSYMEKYEALYHYFSNVKPNFWQLPPLSVGLYLKLQKLLIFDFSAILGLPYFIITKLKTCHVCKIFKSDVNFFTFCDKFLAAHTMNEKFRAESSKSYSVHTLDWKYCYNETL